MKWNLDFIPQKNKWGHLNWTFHLLTPWCPFVITLSPHLTSATQTHLTDIKQRSGPITSPYWLAPAAAKPLQSCLTLCNPIDSSSPGSTVPGILQPTGVGCQFLLQCMKLKSESEVAQSCPTPSDPMDCSLQGSSIRGIFQARVLEWVAIAFSNWLARKRHFMWNQSPKQEVEEKKKRHKFRVKTDLNPNPSSSTLWLRATLSLEPQFLHL